MSARVVFEFGVPVTMRDGVALVADVYRPDDGGRHPVLLTRTPYDRTFRMPHFATLDPLKMAKAGYAVVIQDVRGRFASEGDFEPYTSEAEDGFDTLAWLVEQPWSDGTAGMYGVSYMAQCQLLAASRRPPSLRAIIPVQSPDSALGGDRYRGGALQLGLLASWGGGIGLGELARRMRANPEYQADFLRMVEDVDHMDDWLWSLPLVPFPPIDERGGGLSPLFARTVRGEFLPPRPRFGLEDLAAPALIVAGWYDVFLQPDLDQFAGLRVAAGSEDARRLSRLVVGPWSHGAFFAPVGEIDYGLRASPFFLDLREDLTAFQRRWFDARLRGQATGIDDEAPVKVFVMGTNRWAEETEWPPARVRTERWHLHAAGPAEVATGAAGDTRGERGGGVGGGGGSDQDVARGRRQGGLSQAPPAESSPCVFRLDPDNPVRTLGGNLLMSPHHIKGPREQARTEAHPDVLRFTSAPLEHPLELRGRVRLVAWVAAETADSDVVARLCDVHPDGRSYNVVDGILRLRYRDSLSDPAPMPRGEPVRVEVDLWSTAHVFAAGHRLRLQVCASDFPRYDRCPGDGRTSAEADRVLPQVNRLFHDPERPSHLELPVL
ncbi:MAG TPA: CocE/NonD family hydrolase [Candidatus Dormibacteraeota bacterium]|nr:CocE/NonD family hydrolase [Candidatus Dormibacteraeota bacterium]